MLKKVFCAELIKNYLTRNNYRCICTSKGLFESEKKPCNNQKSDKQCKSTSDDAEDPSERKPCSQKKVKRNVKCETIEDKVSTSDKSDRFKICVKDPCVEAQPGFTEPPCGKSALDTVVCETEDKTEDADEAGEIAIEPLVSCSFNDSKVVIIGAGLAGLAAAKYLEENQISNYVILEAQNRAGGRIHSEWFSDTVVEMGVALPKSSSSIYSFVQSAMVDGFIAPPLSYMSIFKTCDGHTINPTIGFTAYEIFKRILKETVDLETHPLDFINFKIEQEVSQFPSHIQQDVARVLLGLLAMNFKRENGNLSQFIQRDESVYYLQSPGGKLKVPLGYYGNVQPLLSKIPPDNIQFNKPVQSVRWGAVVCKDTPRALVKCCDGSVYPADYVIITVSLGVLKENHDTFFCPALPSEKVEAINCMDFYNLNKMYFEFKEPFWSWCPSTIDIKRSEDKKVKDWTKGITSIRQMPGSNNVLYVSVDGKEANIVEKLPESTVLESVVSIIEKQMNIKNIPCIKNFLISRWSNNVYFKGANSVLPANVPDGIQQKLSNPLPGNNAPVNPILFFAGEATCPKLSGTVQAAKISGIREAARIKKIITSDMDVSDEEQLSISL